MKDCGEDDLKNDKERKRPPVECDHERGVFFGGGVIDRARAGLDGCDPNNLTHRLHCLHHLTQYELNEALRSPARQSLLTHPRRRIRVHLVQNAEGDRVGVMCQHAIEVRGVDHDSLELTRRRKHYRLLRVEALVEHAEEEAKLAGHAERIVAEVSQNRLLQTGNTPEEEDNPVQEAVGDVVLQAHQEGSVGETPTKRLLVVLGEVDVVEPIMIQFHFLEA